MHFSVLSVNVDIPDSLSSSVSATPRRRPSPPFAPVPGKQKGPRPAAKAEPGLTFDKGSISVAAAGAGVVTALTGTLKPQPCSYLWTVYSRSEEHTSELQSQSN